MPADTKLDVNGLATDPSGQLAEASGNLRKANNVVIRASGVAESRPNFDLYAENDANIGILSKNLVEFEGEVLSVDNDPTFNLWGLRRLTTNAVFLDPVGTTNAVRPVNYDQVETKFLEARQKLYLTTTYGILALADIFSTGTLDFAGVDMLSITDLVTAAANYSTPAYSWAYQFVFKRTDEYGYTRRSPPSERMVVTAAHPVIPHTLTRIYFHQRMKIGDQVEIYRSRADAGTSPSPDMYLSYTYTITNADAGVGYFTPPYDNTTDDQLGAELYTNIAQAGAIQAKYIPPQSQLITQFQQCTWYARSQQKYRTEPLTLRSVGLGGPVTSPQVATFVSGSPSVTVGDTSVYTVGAYYSDNTQFGSSFAGTYVPALTTIFSIGGPTTLILSANALASGSVIAGMMDPGAPQGLAAGIAGPGTHVIGTTNVTVADTTYLKAGMGWSNSASGPATAGTLTQADTRIVVVTSPTTFTISKTALASGSGGAAYDCFEIATVPFYLVDTTIENLGLKHPVWTWPTRCFPYFDQRLGPETSFVTVLTCLALAVNYWNLTHPTTFKVRAVPIGDTNLDDGQHGVVGNTAKTIVFEETLGVGGNAFTVLISRPNAFSPNGGTYTTPATNKPNRVYFSDLNEPESVPLINFFDLGSESAKILALVPLQNALLVFKEDGIWRVTGFGPTNWNAEILDNKIRLVRPEAVGVVNNIAFCWATRGFFAVTETSSQSISANLLDFDLRNNYLQNVLDHPTTHATWVFPWSARQLVLFGMPGEVGASHTTKIYCFSLVTNQFSEWPLNWQAVGNSPSDNFYYARIPSDDVIYEVRQAKPTIQGYDRSYSYHNFASVITFGGVTTVFITAAHIGKWQPIVGDIFSRTVSGQQQWRRITNVFTDVNGSLLTLEAPFPASSVIPGDWLYTGHEMGTCIIELEWLPMTPPGIPFGSLIRELQIQFDLRLGPDDKNLSLPRYEAGGTSELGGPYTLLLNTAPTNRFPRLNTVQPIRMGISRQVARCTSFAAYLKTSDIFCMRINGISLVFSPYSEKTRR